MDRFPSSFTGPVFIQGGECVTGRKVVNGPKTNMVHLCSSENDWFPSSESQIFHFLLHFQETQLLVLGKSNYSLSVFNQKTWGNKQLEFPKWSKRGCYTGFLSTSLKVCVWLDLLHLIRFQWISGCLSRKDVCPKVCWSYKVLFKNSFKFYWNNKLGLASSIYCKSKASTQRHFSATNADHFQICCIAPLDKVVCP